jgi:tetratricopeptide (TPR) repeat protein
MHVVNVILVWLVIREVTGAEGDPEQALAPLLAALVFAVHPVVTEAVCEPTFREDLLVALCTLSALVLAMRHDPATPGFDTRRAIGCTALCLLAIASKEAGIVAPMLLAAYWWLFRRGEPDRFWAITIGSAKLVVVAFLAARFLLEPSPSSIFEFKPAYPGGSLSQAMLLEPRILALYAQLILFPVNLCADYGLASVSHLPLPLALLLLATIAVTGALAARHDRRLLFAYCMILLPLVPVSNLIPIYRAAADRYLYLPMAGVALAVACLLDAPWLVGRKPLRQRILVGCMAAVAALGVSCIERQAVWANSLTLWDDSYRKNPGSFTNAAGLGEALREAGRLPEAEQFTREAIRLSNGERGDVWATLALILDEQGRAADSATALAKALELEPRLSDPEARVQSLAMDRAMAEDLKRLLGTTKVGWPERKKTGY